MTLSSVIEYKNHSLNQTDTYLIFKNLTYMTFYSHFHHYPKKKIKDSMIVKENISNYVYLFKLKVVAKYRSTVKIEISNWTNHLLM